MCFNWVCLLNAVHFSKVSIDIGPAAQFSPQPCFQSAGTHCGLNPCSSAPMMASYNHASSVDSPAHHTCNCCSQYVIYAAPT